MRKILLFIFVFLLSVDSSNAQPFQKNNSRNVEKGLFGKSPGKRKKVKEPRSVIKAKKKQEANDKRLKKEYSKSVKRSQKRTVDIQTAEVQARMRQDQKDIAARDKAKKQKQKSGTKKAGNKYN